MDVYEPIQRSSLPLGVKVAMAVWSLVNMSLYRWSPKRCNGFRRMLVRAFGGTIASDVQLNNRARIDCPWNVTMGAMAGIGEYSWIYALDRIEIGAKACIGQHVFLLTGSHDIEKLDFPLVTAPIIIGLGCWLAVRSTVLPGVVVGDYSVIGACSVVSRNVPERVIAVGNPCKIVNSRRLGE